MKKIKCVLIISLLLVSCKEKQPTYNLWYVSNAKEGNGSADSWDNAQLLSDFNWGNVEPSDTVWIDGGADSLEYASSLLPACEGIAGKKIVITRGKDLGHNGKPIFSGGAISSAATLSTNYLEINNLIFKNGGDCSVNFAGCDNIDFINCEILFDGAFNLNGKVSQGIELNGATNTRILYCTISTGLINIDSETDGIWMSGGRDLEIAYCTIAVENIDTNSRNHKDIIQSSKWQLSGGLTKIHHNFLVNSPTRKTTYTSGYYQKDCLGDYLIYNNVIMINGNEGAAFSFQSPDCGRKHKFSATFYNNTIYVGSEQQTLSFGGADTLIFKNNIVYKPTQIGMTWALMIGNITNPFKDIDYNQYVVDDPKKFVYQSECGTGPTLSFTQWKAAYGVDNHSKCFEGPTGIIFAGSMPSRSVKDYQLVKGSSGIGEGLDLSAYFTDDFLGRSRLLGRAWDIGAFCQK